jgi:hypothetical protein
MPERTQGRLTPASVLRDFRLRQTTENETKSLLGDISKEVFLIADKQV